MVKKSNPDADNEIDYMDLHFPEDDDRNKTTIEQFYKLLSNARRLDIDDNDFINNICK